MKREVKAIQRKIYTGVDAEFRDENAVKLTQYRTSQTSYSEGNPAEGFVDSTHHSSNDGSYSESSHQHPQHPAAVELSKPAAPPPTPPTDRRALEQPVHGSPIVSIVCVG